MQTDPCALCPRSCGANRALSAGRCGVGGTAVVARAAPHHWEEPCISGTRGSGTVFFAGCPLGCVFCQNHAISRGSVGQRVSTGELAGLFLELQRKAVHNLNLVTAGHFRPAVQEALAAARQQGLKLPVVWNTGGYENRQAITALAGDVDIWLADLKFYSPALSARLADAPDYFAVASQAVSDMVRLAGPPVLDDDGLLRRGVIIRLLVLPGEREDAKALLEWLASHLPPKGWLLSLMSQYTPPSGLELPKPLNRRVASFEYNEVLNKAVHLGLTQGFAQQRSSAQPWYTPHFPKEEPL